MKTQQINFRLSETARNNLAVICETSGVNQTAAVEMAIAALAKGLTMNTMNLEQACQKALSGFFRDGPMWTGGVVIIREKTGGFDAIPGAYLSNISYTGSRDVVVAWQHYDYLPNGIDKNSTGAQLAEKISVQNAR